MRWTVLELVQNLTLESSMKVSCSLSALDCLGDNKVVCTRLSNDFETPVAVEELCNHTLQRPDNA
jgi:hypothetical protein